MSIHEKAQGWNPPNWFLIACHIVVPAVFLGVAWWHFCDPCCPVRWEGIVLLVIGMLPFLVPLAWNYFDSLGKEGAKARRDWQQSAILPDVAQSIEKSQAPDHQVSKDAEQKPSRSPEEAVQLLIERTLQDPTAQKVYRTLKRFQFRSFGENKEKRWGFKLAENADVYPQFRVGVDLLKRVGLVMENDQGLVFLTTAGVNYEPKDCEILKGDIWDQFP